MSALQVFLATDADAAGGNLAAELARRLKRHRCKITDWPTGWQDHLVYMDMDTAAKRVSEFEAVRCSIPAQCWRVLAPVQVNKWGRC